MREAVQVFKALADATRLRILNLLARGELCVCDIMKILEIGQSKTSRHLAYLKNAGLVTDRREGLWIHYSVSPSDELLQQLMLTWLIEEENEIPHAASDLKKLKTLRKDRAWGTRCGRERTASRAAQRCPSCKR